MLTIHARFVLGQRLDPAALSRDELLEAINAVNAEMQKRSLETRLATKRRIEPGDFRLLTDIELVEYHKELLQELARRTEFRTNMMTREERKQSGEQTSRVYLGDIARIAIPGIKSTRTAPDFWAQRNGSERSVGMPVKDGTYPDWFGIWVNPGYSSDEVYTSMLSLWRSGYFKNLAHGSLPLQHIRRNDVHHAPVELFNVPTSHSDVL